MITFVVIVALLIMPIGCMYLFPYRSVQFPATCSDVSAIGSNYTIYGNYIDSNLLTAQTRTKIPLQYIQPNFSIPTVGRGVLLASDAKSAVVVVVDYNNSLFNSTLLLVNKSDNSILKEMSFNNDFLAATINSNILYVFNSGLGYFIDTNNGMSVNRIFTIDNYRGISLSHNIVTMRTTAVVAGLYASGRVMYQSKMTFSDIDYGCIVDQSTMEKTNH